MFDARFGQLSGDHFRFLDRNRPDQHWLTVRGTLFNIFDNGCGFFRFGRVDQIRQNLYGSSDGWSEQRRCPAYRWEELNSKASVSRRTPVIPASFHTDGSSSGGNRRQRLVFILNFSALLSLLPHGADRQTSDALHGTTGMFHPSNDDAVFHNVIHVTGKTARARCWPPALT